MEDYKKAGVNIEEGYETVKLIKQMTRKTKIPGVLNDLGSFAGLFELSKLKNPVLVSGTDGVGTKLEIAIKKGVYDTVGQDCVAMCVNDIICHGAKPLFFLDYIACGKLERTTAARIVQGICDGCVKAGCALLGGETAEMPGFYDEGKYDIAGFAVGLAEKDELITGDGVRKGDVLVGLASSGLHSNGFSLVRHLIKDYDAPFKGQPIWKELLKPTRIYVDSVLKAVKRFNIKGIAHITGGGLYENVPRMSARPYTYTIEKASIPENEIFGYIASKGISERDMYATFNMGVGMILCVEDALADELLESLESWGEVAFKMGTIEEGGKGVLLNIAVLVSGGGTNLQAVIDYVKREDIDARVRLVISDRDGAYALERARKAGIENIMLERKIYKGELSNEILSRVSGCDLIVLAGFLSILSGEILKVYENKIINVHPSLIPSFCGPKMYGIKVHEAAIEKGVKISGCSVHVVDAGTDTGRILVQKAVRVQPDDTAQSLATRILPYEHEALCEAIGMFIQSRV